MHKKSVFGGEAATIYGTTTNIFPHGRHLSMWLCHDENQKYKISHEESQNLKGTRPVCFDGQFIGHTEKTFREHPDDRQVAPTGANRVGTRFCASETVATRDRRAFMCQPWVQAHSGAVYGMARRRRRPSVNRIEEKIKKCQICRNPCKSGPNPIFQRRPSCHGAQTARLTIVRRGLNAALQVNLTRQPWHA